MDMDNSNTLSRSSLGHAEEDFVHDPQIIMLVEQTMLHMMVAMVMTCLIPAVTYAVQVDFLKVPHRYHKIHSSLTHDESDVDPHPSRIIDDAFDNAHIIKIDDKIRAPSTSGLDSQLQHGLVQRLRRSQNNQHWDQENDKKNHDKGRTLKSSRTENKYEHKLLKDHERISEKEHERINLDENEHNRRITSKYLGGTPAHKPTQKNTELTTSSKKDENVADLKVHHKRVKRDGPAAPLPPSLPLPTHPPPPGMGEDQPWKGVPPPPHFPYINQVPHDNNIMTQTTRMPTTSSTNQSGDGIGSAISHLYGTTHWTLALATLLSLVIHVLL